MALSEQFDQAGLFLKTSPERWVKAGVEFVDGAPCLGVVATDGCSDWSAFPVPSWSGRKATIRASRTGDALTIRAKVDEEPFQMIRLAPLDPDVVLHAGPFLCAPTRAGLTVRFHAWRTAAPDATLH